MKLYSHAYGREFNVEICPKNNGEQFSVISHKSLQDIHDIELRGMLNTSLNVVKDSATHAIVECQITDTAAAFAVVEIGEKMKTANDSEIGKSFPVTTAYTRAFDRAMIRILGFEGKFYSDVEMSDDKHCSTISDNTKSDIISDSFTEEPIESSAAAEESFVVTEEMNEIREIPEDDSEGLESIVCEEIEGETEEEPLLSDDLSVTLPETEETALNDPGAYQVITGRKKGKSLNEIYVEEDGKGKSWLDYCLGSQYVKDCDKEAIVKFYSSKDVSVDEGDADYLVSARKYYAENVERLGGTLNG